MQVDDPIIRIQRWFEAAQRGRTPLPESAALATVDQSGHPSVRFVLVKQMDEHGFVFFTDSRSRKGEELRQNARAALVLYWNSTGRQVRVEGAVEKVDDVTADAYWKTRPRESRLAAAASKQSSPLRRREDLSSRLARLRVQHRGRLVPRPPEWTGFRVVPEQVELWTRGANRLHHRELYTKRRGGWRKSLLQP